MSKPTIREQIEEMFENYESTVAKANEKAKELGHQHFVEKQAEAVEIATKTLESLISQSVIEARQKDSDEILRLQAHKGYTFQEAVLAVRATLATKNKTLANKGDSILGVEIVEKDWMPDGKFMLATPQSKEGE